MTKRTWQIHEARDRLSEVIRRAEAEGPQTITVRGQPRAVVTAIARRGTAPGTETESLLDFFRRSPLWGAGLDFERDRSPMREPGVDRG
ncbi:MAG: type II toxin-antitoxin system prevent-host-death family antitoxin [Chloroflexi bacterium]|nr:type II toxin-antitoxin system prevent-host-death family antitoxin [Chloroflexota bacterium]